jgi:hypothetical protein
MGFVYATVSTSAPAYALPEGTTSLWVTCAGLGYNATAADGAAVPPSPAELRLAGSFLFVLLNAVSVRTSPAQLCIAKFPQHTNRQAAAVPPSPAELRLAGSFLLCY